MNPFNNFGRSRLLRSSAWKFDLLNFGSEARAGPLSGRKAGQDLFLDHFFFFVGQRGREEQMVNSENVSAHPPLLCGLRSRPLQRVEIDQACGPLFVQSWVAVFSIWFRFFHIIISCQIIGPLFVIRVGRRYFYILI